MTRSLFLQHRGPRIPLPASKTILALNAGSSSLKFALFQVGQHGNPTLVSKGKIDSAGAEPRLVSIEPGDTALADYRLPSDLRAGHDQIVAELINWAETQGEEARSLPSVTGRWGA